MKIPRPDLFLSGLAAAVALGLLWPDGGKNGGVLPLDWVSRYGVCVIFFIYGLTLDPARLMHGVRIWKVHFLVQLTSYAIFPLLVALAWLSLANLLPFNGWMGFVYLAALPTTVASSVALVARANGNVAVAIFNVTVSSLLSVLLTPLIISTFLHQSATPLPLVPTMSKVALLVLLPLVLGQVARLWLANWAEANRALLKPIDRIIVLLIVYASFAESVATNVWGNEGLQLVLTVAVGCAVLMGIVYVALDRAAVVLRVNAPDRIAALYCGVQKSLATGVPLAPVIFPNNPDLGLIILPILIFHFGQLAVFGLLAPRHAKQLEAAGADAGM